MQWAGEERSLGLKVTFRAEWLSVEACRSPGAAAAGEEDILEMERCIGMDGRQRPAKEKKKISIISRFFISKLEIKLDILRVFPSNSRFSL